MKKFCFITHDDCHRGCRGGCAILRRAKVNAASAVIFRSLGIFCLSMLAGYALARVLIYVGI